MFAGKDEDETKEADNKEPEQEDGDDSVPGDNSEPAATVDDSQAGECLGSSSLVCWLAVGWILLLLKQCSMIAQSDRKVFRLVIWSKMSLNS